MAFGMTGNRRDHVAQPSDGCEQKKWNVTANDTGVKSKGCDKGITYCRRMFHNTNQSIEVYARARGKSRVELGICLRSKHHGF